MDLKKIRRQRGFTQEKLAELLNIHENTLRTWETGISEPRASDISKLCEVLHCSESELLNGPTTENWELKIKLAKEGVIEVGTMGTAFDLSVGNTAMAVTVSGSYDIWEDEAKFEEQIIAKLRKSRQVALNLHKEAF